MKIYFRNKSLNINVKKLSFVGMIRGLMFRRKENLLFEFSKKKKWAIHSFFVFYSFLAVWLDEKNRVLEWKIVKPFSTRIVPKKCFVRLIEVPLSRENGGIIEFFVGKERFK